MKFTLDGDGEIIGMTLTRDSGDVNLKKFGDSDFYGPDNENKTVLELAYDSLGKEMGLSYPDFGLIGITSSMGDEQSQSPDEFSVPFAGGYAAKQIDVANIDTDMTFSGRATGRVAKGAHIVQLQQDAARPTTLTFDTQSDKSTLKANFNNWYDVTVDSTGAISFTDYKDNNHPGGTSINMQLAATPDDGTITAGGATMNVGYYGPSTTPTQATGLVHYQEKDVENPVSLDMAFGVK